MKFNILSYDILYIICHIDISMFKIFPMICKQTAKILFDYNFNKKSTWIKKNKNYIIKQKFVNGFHHGKYELYKNGNRIMLGFYYQNKRHGEWKEWHPNGKPYKIINYRYNKKHGHYKHWDQNGNLVKHYLYQHDKYIGNYEWYFSDKTNDFEYGMFDVKKDLIDEYCY